MASSSSTSSSAPAISSRSWKQHVFLSFRGEDTRNNFVGHLYTALVNKGIITYKDDQKLSLGEAISPSLIEAIEQSQFAIIVFSEHYANSSWCLNELRHIMKCRKERGLIVVPIFYGVEPSEVRKQEKKYGEAFSKYELENNTNVASWREALVEACGNSGQDFKSGNMDESQLIKNIVNKITKMKRPLTPRVNEKLVGVEARRDALISKLQIEPDCVRMIGIWGVGGGGKTTLATSVYSMISWEFDGCCYIENVRDESSKNGLVTLQKKIISGVLKQDEVLGSIEEGKDMIRDMLSGKKVLIVLDDVDQLDQLEALAGACDWFGKGSRIIITTRNEHLLKVHKVGVYNVTLLHNDEATTLLHKCARLEERLMKDYEEVSQELVTYASGLPLALTVLGSFLCGRGIKEWTETLAKLKEIPNNDIVGKLRISYDGLEKVEQDLFLHIACFFRGVYKHYAMPVFEACGLYPEIGLEVLREKALITISNDGPFGLFDMFDMHDLVQEMAHHIVRGEHHNDPEKHSRIWKKEYVETICAMGATTDLDMIEAISYSYKSVPYWRDPSEYFWAIFRSKEGELKFISESANQLQHLPRAVVNMKNLKWVDWEGVCPLLTNSPLNKLCCLTLSISLQKQLWDGHKPLPNLKMMKLYGFKNLIMLPNLAGLPNLERFELAYCPKLQEIHSSFGLLEKLVFVSVEYCSRIKIFPSINRLKNLKTVSFKGSTRLFKLIQHEQPSFFFFFTSKIRKMKQPSLPYSNMNHHTRLRFSQPNLTKLNLCTCELTDEDICSYKWELSHLQELDLSRNEFSRLDFSGWRLPRLKWLCVDCCGSLVELSDLPSSIAVVEANYCRSLKSFGDTSNCKWLWKVTTRDGNKVDLIHGERLLNSMLQGNAIEDHFISLILPYRIPKGYVGRFFRENILTLMSRNPVTLELPDDWHNDFSGLLIRIVNPDPIWIDIIMKQKADKEDRRFENRWESDGEWQECDEAPKPEYGAEIRTHVIYVSFGSIRKTTSLNSSYNKILFSIKSDYSWFASELVPMKSKHDGGQSIKVATNCSEFRDEEDGYFTSSTNFLIHQKSNSDIKISWSSRTKKPV